jgi:parallel beta-helix repeat protein
MIGRVAAVWLSWIMVISCLVIIIDFSEPVKGSNVIYVDDGGGGDYSCIQTAIDNASVGDTVYVHSGIYFENVIVNKTITLRGQEPDNTKIVSSGKSTIHVSSSHVNITSLWLQGSKGGTPMEAGIWLENVSDCEIYDNIITSNDRGIYLEESTYNYIHENDVYLNNNSGISLSKSDFNTIESNFVYSNGGDGIKLFSSTYNTISNNVINDDGIFFGGGELSHYNTNDVENNNLVNGKQLCLLKDRSGVIIDDIHIGQLIIINCYDVTVRNLDINNTDWGIEIAYSEDLRIMDCSLTNNHQGMYICKSSSLTIEHNDITNNTSDGLVLYSSSGNDVINCDISHNQYSISLFYAHGNIISDNNITHNQWPPVIDFSTNNLFYHNNFMNNAFFIWDSDISMWDNGYPSGGNYWDDYNGQDDMRGSDQDQQGSDGIGDIPHQIGSSSQDNYPLMEPWIVDHIPPKIDLISPFNNSFIKPGTLIDLSIIDPRLTEVTYMFNGGSFKILEAPYIVNTDHWNNGNHRIEISAKDQSGNENTHWFTFTVDSTIPSISLDSPDNNSILNSDFEIEFSIYDLNLYGSWYTRNGGSPKYLSYDSKIDTRSWQDGEYEITMVAEDLAGNQMRKLFIFTKDTQEPEIILKPPPENGSMILESKDLEFDILDENIEKVSYKLNSGPLITLEDPFKIDTNFWDDDEYTITLQAQDKAGNVAVNWFIFRNDRKPPAITSNTIEDSGRDIPIDSNIMVVFTEQMDRESVENAISISPNVDYFCLWTNNNETLTIMYDETLEYGTTYKFSISDKAKDLAARGLEDAYELEFTTEPRPKGPASYQFPFHILLILMVTILIIIFLAAYARRTRKPSEDYSYVPIDVSKVKQVTCHNCNNINQVKDTGTTVNFQCSFCQNNLTAHLGQKLPHFQSARQIKTLTQRSCPECRYVFDVEKYGIPRNVKCPNCGTMRMMR